VPHELGLIQEQHAEAFEAAPFAKLPEGPVEHEGHEVMLRVHGGHPVGEARGVPPRVVRVVANAHGLEVLRRLHGESVPLAGYEVLGCTEVRGVVLIGDLDDGAHPVPKDVVAVPVLQDLLLILGDHPEGNARGSPGDTHGGIWRQADGVEQLREPRSVGFQPLGVPGLQGRLPGATGRQRDAVGLSEQHALQVPLTRRHRRGPPKLPNRGRRGCG